MVVGNMKYLCHEQCVSGRAPRLSLVEEDLSTPPEHPNATRFYVGIVWLESSFFLMFRRSMFFICFFFIDFYDFGLPL